MWFKANKFETLDAIHNNLKKYSSPNMTLWGMGSLKKPMAIAGTEKFFKEPLQKCLGPETLKENSSSL